MCPAATARYCPLSDREGDLPPEGGTGWSWSIQEDLEYLEKTKTEQNSYYFILLLWFPMANTAQISNLILVRNKSKSHISQIMSSFVASGKTSWEKVFLWGDGLPWSNLAVYQWLLHTSGQYSSGKSWRMKLQGRQESSRGNNLHVQGGCRSWLRILLKQEGFC